MFGKLCQRIKSLYFTLIMFFYCQTLRAFEGNEAQVSIFIIQMLLLTSNEFQSRVSDFVRDIPTEHWKQSNYHDKHVAFHMVSIQINSVACFQSFPTFS